MWWKSYPKFKPNFCITGHQILPINIHIQVILGALCFGYYSVKLQALTKQSISDWRRVTFTEHRTSINSNCFLLISVVTLCNSFVSKLWFVREWCLIISVHFCLLPPSISHRDICSSELHRCPALFVPSSGQRWAPHHHLVLQRIRHCIQ